MADRAQSACGAIDGFPRLPMTLSARAGHSARLPGPLAGIERFRSARDCLNSVGPVMAWRGPRTPGPTDLDAATQAEETAGVGAVPDPRTGMQWHWCMVDPRDSMENRAPIDAVYG
jgi:hypothetical protein